MSLYSEWTKLAYNEGATQQQIQMFWANYFNIEKGIYDQLLSRKTAVKGTLKELAEKFKTEPVYMAGFMDGINDSLKKPYEQEALEAFEEDTEVSLAFDEEKLYKNMVDAKADWLYNLPQWKERFEEDKLKALYKEAKNMHTIVKDKKIGRNDPCPCGSGKKYKQCCMKKAN